MKKKTVLTQAVVIVAIIMVVNLILNQIYFRIDFTADKKYTLSQATKDLLKNIDDAVTITAYWSKNLPPQLQGHKQDFVDMLIEYENRSGGNVVYVVENPNESEEKMREVQQKGIQPVPVEITEKDQMQQMLAFMGAIMQQGEKTETISFIPPRSNVEFLLTQALKKLTVEDKPQVAVLQGHGEPGLDQMPQLAEALSTLYEVVDYTITDTSDIPGYFNSIAIFSPTDTFPESHLAKLDAYLRQGGGILLGYNGLQPDLSMGYLNTAPDIGLKNWLKGKGVELEDQFVIDVNCASVGVMQQIGPMQVQRRIRMPLIPIINNFADHPASSGLEALLLQFASPIHPGNKDSLFVATALGYTSDQSGSLIPPTGFDFQREWQENDFRQSNIPVALALEGVGEWSAARMVAVSNGNFAVNGPEGQAQSLSPDNINFASNAIDWLSDDTGLIELRTKGATARLLKPVTEDKRLLMKWGNVLAPILIILTIGVIRRQRNQRKKQRWLQGEY